MNERFHMLDSRNAGSMSAHCSVPSRFRFSVYVHVYKGEVLRIRSLMKSSIRTILQVGR